MTQIIGSLEYVRSWRYGRAIQEEAKPFGVFVGVARKKNGDIKEVRITKNLITNIGRAGIASRLGGSGALPPFTYIATGEGKSEAVAEDVALEKEITDRGFARVNATSRRVTSRVENDTFLLQNTFVATGKVKLSEIAIFNEPQGGIMLCRKTFTPVELEETDAYRVEYGIEC